MELLKEGVRYFPHMYVDEEELEKIVFEHFKDIFGKSSILIPKQKIKALSGIGTIPDGFVLLTEEKKWYVIEIELASHPLHDHIVTQISKFNLASKNGKSQKALAEAFFEESKNDSLMSAITEKYKYISEIMESEPEIIIIIDKEAKELEDACGNLPFRSIIVTFETYFREGGGIEDHIHAFKPPFLKARNPNEKIEKYRKSKRNSDVDIIDLINANYVKPGLILYRTYKGEMVKAEILNNGKIRILRDGKVEDSLSTAAVHVTGTAINGWMWWKYRDDTGQEYLIDNLREKYLQKTGE